MTTDTDSGIKSDSDPKAEIVPLYRQKEYYAKPAANAPGDLLRRIEGADRTIAHLNEQLRDSYERHANLSTLNTDLRRENHWLWISICVAVVTLICLAFWTR